MMLFAQWIDRFVRENPTRRSIIIFAIHTAAFAVAYLVAYVLRLGIPLPNFYLQLFWVTLPLVLVLKLAIFYGLGHGRLSWRHATFSDLTAVLRASTLATLVLATLDLMISRSSSRIPFTALEISEGILIIPRGLLVLDWMMTLLTLGGLRALWRLSREEFRTILAWKGCRKALIIGADATGESLARQFLNDHSLNYLAVGFLDDEPGRRGTRVGGLRILGTSSEAVRIAQEQEATEILVISGMLAGQNLRSLMEECKAAGLNLKVIPAMDDLLSGDYTLQIRDVNINDLLRREPVELSDDKIRALVAGQTVMVTGAGGSIGSEICRQVLKFKPRQLILVERSENSLFLIDREFDVRKSELDIQPVLADITDCVRMDRLFDQYRPQVVFHAAAHKHVPLMEYNPGEAIKNNVLGTIGLAELANQYEVQRFVLISTDKSVNPTSIMGVSKQLAERFVHAFSEIGHTQFVVVRFGNVLASAGSVVPIFQEQIRAGGPITVTHPDMERFFMTIPEASQLVLQAAAMGSGGEIFVLDMGHPVKIVDLAHDLIRLSKLSPDDIEIRFTGLRPGEKLYEELYFDDEQMLPTPHPKLFAAYHRPFDLASVRESVEKLAAVADGPPEVLRGALREVVPEYAAAKPECELFADQQDIDDGDGTTAAERRGPLAHEKVVPNPHIEN